MFVTENPIDCRPPYAKRNVEVHFKVGHLRGRPEYRIRDGAFGATLRRALVTTRAAHFTVDEEKLTNKKESSSQTTVLKYFSPPRSLARRASSTYTYRACSETLMMNVCGIS